MSLSAIKARRAAKRAELEEAREEQLAVDYEAIEKLEDSIGASSVRAFEVTAYISGLPAALAVRCPDGAERNHYHSALKPKQTRRGQTVPADAIEAVIDLGLRCLVYPPEGEDRARLLRERPGLKVQAGNIAVALSEGVEEEEGKG